METPEPTKKRRRGEGNGGKPRLGLIVVDGGQYTIPAACRIKGASSQAVYHHIAKNGLSAQQAFEMVRPYARRGRT